MYEWRGDQLVVVKPDDKRMQGLAWAWNGQTLVLAAEPPNHPTGASYLGTTLKKATGEQ